MQDRGQVLRVRYLHVMMSFFTVHTHSQANAKCVRYVWTLSWSPWKGELSYHTPQISDVVVWVATKMAEQPELCLWYFHDYSWVNSLSYDHYLHMAMLQWYEETRAAVTKTTFYILSGNRTTVALNEHFLINKLATVCMQ